MRIFMATGYLVSTGQNPYVAQDLTSVFHSASFRGFTSIGYPPPWALLLGVIYRCVYAVFPNFLAYNLAIKLPIIAANVGLAYLAVSILRQLGTDERIARRYWVFMLFNPLLLYFGSAWGQFDSIVALLSLAALLLLDAGKSGHSAILLALAISFKPTALPLLPVSLAHQWGKSPAHAARYLGLFSLGAALFSVAPFAVFGWSPEVILSHWDAQMLVGGGMSLVTFLELLRGSYQLPDGWRWLGFAWVPALAAGLLALRGGVVSMDGLLKKGTGLILVFFLTRAWLSEPNVLLLLPLVLILTVTGDLKPLALAGLCILPLVFTVFNASPPQLLFPAFPGLFEAAFMVPYWLRIAALVARSILVIPWQALGWWIACSCLTGRSPGAPKSSTALEGRVPGDGQGSHSAPPGPMVRLPITSTLFPMRTLRWISSFHYGTGSR